jgi:hypothetical protein
MSSWRDNASPRAQEQLDELLNVALGFAQHQLAERGEFFPYASAIKDDGKAEMIAGQPAPEVERPAAADVIASCVQALVDRRERIEAAAIVADVSTADGDAIRVELEHAEGHALTVLLPYEKRPGGTVEYGQITAQPGEMRVWASA